MHEIDKVRFGEIIAAARKERGMTQKDLAQKLFISDKAVSKWETGVSLPDTSLLIPLSETLGVPVAELLTGQKDPEPETAVKTVLNYSEDESRSNRGQLVRRAVLYAVLVLIAAAEFTVNNYLGYFSLEVTGILVMSLLFSAYFFFWAKASLPGYYDQNKISHLSHGIVRMNLPGVRFTNGNWPHILRVGRVWSGAMLVLFIPLCRLAGTLLPTEWETRAPVLLAIIGLIVPIYLAAKKQE